MTRTPRTDEAIGASLGHGRIRDENGKLVDELVEDLIARLKDLCSKLEQGY